MRSFISSVLLFALCLPLHAQSKDKSAAQQPPVVASPATQAPRPAVKFGLSDGTPIKLRIARTVSSADAKVGETVDFEVLEDVKFGETIIIPKGGLALATITAALPRRRMGRGGKLNLNIDSARLSSGEKIALRAVKNAEGGGRVGGMTAAMVATGILFFPAAPLFLFMKGKEITIPKGTEVTAYINGDAELDKAKFLPDAAAVPPETVAPANAVETDSAIAIKSTPDGAEITIDGKFVGNTPSTLRLKAGDHSIAISKSGFSLWERTITLTANGNITIEAQLEKK